MQAAAVPPELVVRSDNAKLRGRFRAILIMHGSLTIFVLGALTFISTSDSDIMRSFSLVWVILLAGQIFQIAIHSYSWGSRLAISQPLTMDSWGLEFQGQQGTVKVPWEAVPEVRQKAVLGNQLLSFQLHPQAMPGENGVEGDPAYWKRYQKKGLLLGSIGLVPGFETILPAIQHYSQGRTRIV